LPPEPRILRLLFHGLGPPPARVPPREHRFWVPLGAFESLLDALGPRPDVRISFDDGLASDAELALPALCARGLRADFFVIAGCIGAPGYLDRAQLAALAAAHMRIGTHGMHHRSWRRLPASELAVELVDARRVLEDWIGAPVAEAACPFGAYDRRVLGALRAAGYARVYTSDGGLAREEAWLQPRNTVTADLPGARLARLAAGREPRPLAWLRRAKGLWKRWR
jgi:peptidoglycan/xylan/chitin deacetylase (PgdA/CDA1 family)